MVVSTYLRRKGRKKKECHIFKGGTFISIQKCVHFMNFRGKGMGVKAEVQYSV
jgi:hypothetical protein